MIDKSILDCLVVSPDAPMMEAIAVLTRGARKIVLVIDDAQKLLGVITDYDVRMAILDHVSFDESVSKIMKPDPVVVAADAEEHEIISILANRRVAQLPVVDDLGRVVDIHFIEEYQHLQEPHIERTAVIMAGGLGTRLHPVTDRVPKPLLEVGGQPILFILIDQLLSEGFERIYVTLNHMRDMIIASINGVPRYRDKVEFVVEDKPLGTAGSLSLLPQRPQTPFVVINADLVTNVSLDDMLSHHRRDSNAVTLATKRHTHDLPYGVAEIEGSRVVCLREKPTLNYFINTGVYVVSPSVLDGIADDQYIDMTDVVTQLLEDGQQVGSFAVHEYWIDIGTHDQYAKAQEEYPNHFHENGK